MSERITTLIESWKEFNKQGVVSIKDWNKLQELFNKAQLEIERLQDSREKWKKKHEDLNKPITSNKQ
jgi:hypothetical protein